MLADVAGLAELLAAALLAVRGGGVWLACRLLLVRHMQQE
jgi:hypothetical protein